MDTDSPPEESYPIEEEKRYICKSSKEVKIQNELLAFDEYSDEEEEDSND